MRTHPGCRKYMAYGIEVDETDPITGENYTRTVTAVYNVLSFGAALSVMVFHRLVAAVIRVMRCYFMFVGIFFLDDRASVYRSLREGLILEYHTTRLWVRLGTYFSKKKLKPTPAKLIEMLGFALCLSSWKIKMPEGKLSYIERTISELQGKAVWQGRDAARAAGMLLSITPALKLGANLARGLFDVLKGSESHDEIMATDDLRHLCQLIVETLRKYNGKRSISYQQGIRIGGDASDIGIGGGVHDMITGRPCGTMRVQTSFSEKERALINDNKMSSTLREVMAVLVILRAAIRYYPNQTMNRTVTYITDNQGCRDNINKGRSPTCKATTDRIRVILELCACCNIQLNVEWQRRDEIQLWDDFSKAEDGSEWAIDSEIIRGSWSALLVNTGWEEPCLDAMAGAGEFHQLTRYISEYLTDDCWRVDFFASGTAIKQLQFELKGQPIYINGPFGKMIDILALIKSYRIDTILVYPDWQCIWRPLVEQMPKGAETIRIKRRNIYTPSGRVPKRDNLRAAGAAYDTMVAYIRWPA